MLKLKHNIFARIEKQSINETSRIAQQTYKLKFYKGNSKISVGVHHVHV